MNGITVAPELSRALQEVRDALNAGDAEERVFVALNLIDKAALAPRTVPEAEGRVREAEWECETAYGYLRAWTDWVDRLLPHPRGTLTRWDSETARNRIAAVIRAARDWHALPVQKRQRALDAAVVALTEVT